ncbi:hypothetical protein CROQUDRAFT_35382 [Cronartium quercuum f. sp. fusiforme G11]|uniref:type I protein arginine methyltransferase n=1 Tax=Cronartium quercuum f. sp. fusiforme G11 TaxID=708437 RepID=A0A9P6TJ44_9BASI|nr:hypothetical protein CROQUDRAFT_35382 [Cronartium quercuum f. sp. fusiforme G11]
MERFLTIDLFDALEYDFEEEEEDDDESPQVPSVSGLESQSAKKHLQPRQLCSNQVSPQVEIDRLCTELERLRQENSRTRKLLGYTSSLLEDSHATSNSLNPTKPSPKTSRDDDTHYFSSYAHEGIHWTMIQDQIRTDSYRHFITSNPQLFKNKRVLDIGCGTGILSFFAAQAGAKKVYAIDASQIAKNASVNMKVNSITEIVKVLNKKVEDLNVDEDLDGERVDMIISEWMGYACLYEVFLPSVLIARDRFLKPKDCGGLMAPSQCSILMAGWGDETWWNDKVNWWDNNKYGFKMRESMTERMFKEGLIEDFPASGILTHSMCLRDVLTTTMGSDIKDCISFTQPFTLRISDQQVTNRKFYGFLIWFDTFFTCDGRPIDSLALEDAKKWKQSEGEVGFSTSAKATSTHWHQTLLLVKQPFEVNEDVEIEGSSTWTVQEDNGRELEISMMWRVRQNQQSDWGPYLAQVWTV